MGQDELYDLALEAEDILESSLNEEDRAKLQDIYKDISRQIRWGTVIGDAFPILMDMADHLVESGEAMSKNGSPWYAVSEGDQDLFQDEDPKAMSRKHLLLLLLAKKLLGGLKTRVNQSIQDIRILSPDDETELMEVAEILETESKDLDDDEKEDQNVSTEKDIVAEVDISPEGTCSLGGRHVRTIVRWKRMNEDMIAETYCKDCNQVVRRSKAYDVKTPIEDCPHPRAEWVAGKEGIEAFCPICKEPIEDPSTYQWAAAGLEPYGDDPSKDEAITLCSEY